MGRQSRIGSIRRPVFAKSPNQLMKIPKKIQMKRTKIKIKKISKRRRSEKQRKNSKKKSRKRRKRIPGPNLGSSFKGQ